MKKPVFDLVTLSLVALLFSFTLLPKEKTGVGTKAPKNAELIFDGSRKMLDEKWTYWEGPRFSSELPIKWEIEKDPNNKKKTVVSSNDPTAKGGKYGTADIVTKNKYRDFRLHVEFFIKKKKGNPHHLFSVRFFLPIKSCRVVVYNDSFGSITGIRRSLKYATTQDLFCRRCLSYYRPVQ